MNPNRHSGPSVKLSLNHLYSPLSVSLGDDVHQPLKEELRSTVFNFWPQWLFIMGVTLVWTLVTLVSKIDGCPRGYLGPGGKHEYKKYENCTGGKKSRADLETRGNVLIHFRRCWISRSSNSWKCAYVRFSNMPRYLRH